MGVGLGAAGLAACRHLARRGAHVVGLDAVAVLGRRRAARLYGWTRVLLDEVFEVEPTARRTGSLRLVADDVEREDVRRQAAALRADGFPVDEHDGPEGIGLLVPDDGVVPDPALRHGVRTARLQMLATAPAPDVVRPRPEYRRWGYDYVQQLPSGEVLLGGGRDVGGADEWGADPVPTRTVQAHLDAEPARLGVTALVTHRWAARAAFTDDLLPVVATVDDAVHVVGAYSGHGNLLGPALAVLAADAALDGHGLDDPFRP